MQMGHRTLANNLTSGNHSVAVVFVVTVVVNQLLKFGNTRIQK